MLYSEIQSLGLSFAYIDNEEDPLACRSVMALAFLPSKHVEEAARLIKDGAPRELADFPKIFQIPVNKACAAETRESLSPQASYK